VPPPVEARAWYDRQAKERQKSVGGTGKKAVPVNLPEAVNGDARDQAAKAVGVSGKSARNPKMKLGRLPLSWRAGP
jgi:hypothetical protein